ncbi:MAG: hypothetical protein J6U23_06600 [Clostridiales bacterium]|nr:hypothetical protein [Clostridiales bacterium]
MNNRENLEFNNKKICGLWLILVGAVIGVSLLFGGHFIINPIIFLIGYYVCFFISNFDKKIRAKLSQGKMSGFQKKMIFFSIMSLFFLMSIFSGRYFATWNWRMIWLGVMIATAIHFCTFYFVHGKSMIFLGLACAAIALVGYHLPADKTWISFAADAITKATFGAYLLFLSKPTVSKKTVLVNRKAPANA